MKREEILDIINDVMESEIFDFADELDCNEVANWAADVIEKYMNKKPVGGGSTYDKEVCGLKVRFHNAPSINSFISVSNDEETGVSERCYPFVFIEEELNSYEAYGLLSVFNEAWYELVNL